MKRKFTFLLAALLLMSGLSWAQQITWSAADQGYGNGDVIESVDFNDYVAGEFFKGTNNNAPKYYNTGAAIRCYGGNYFTITSDYALTEIVLSFGSGDGSNAITTDVGTYENGTWTGDASEVTFTVGGTSGHRRIASFTITYTESGTPAPSITASDVEIAYDATEGAIVYTINDGVEEGVLTATTEAEWLTIGTVGETVPFTCSVNPNGVRTATVTLTYTYNTDQTVTKNVTVTQATNPNVPGTQNNPYTVAQALAAIDAGSGTQGVYATGIVSEIVTAYNSQYSNITFDIVDVEGDEAYLRAYRCGGDEAANVTVGDVVVVYGNLTYYTNGGIYEFTQGCQVVSLEHPVVTEPSITVTPATVNVDAEEHEGTLALAYENLTISEMGDFDIQYYNAEGQEAEEPEWIEVSVAEQILSKSEGYVVSYYMVANEGEARSAYFKVYAMDDETNLVYSNLVTINQAEYVVPALDYAELPFEFNGGRADIENTDGLTQEGLGTDYNANTNPTTKLKFDHTGDWMLLHFNEVPGTFSFDIKGNGFSSGTFTVQTSEDGVTYEDLAAYTELGNAETKTFDNLGENVRYIKWIYTEKVQGNVGLGNIHLYEFGGGPAPVASITVAPATVNATVESGEGTLTVTYANITEVVAEVYFCDANGEAAEYDWIDAEINAENNVYYVIEANEGEARTAFLKVYALDNEGGDVYSNLVTINQAEYVVPALDYAELPFEFDGGRADIENTDGLTQEGLDSDYGSSPKLKFNTTGDWLLLHFNEAPGTLLFDIKGNSFNGGTFTVQTSEDGVTYEDLVAYTELGDVETKTVDNLGENVRYIKWIYTEKVSGNVALGNIYLYEFGGGPAPVASITITPDVIDLDAEQNAVQIPFTYENIEVTNYESFTVHYYDAEGEEIQLNPGVDWYYFGVTGNSDEGYQLTGVVIANEGDARSAYMKVSALDANAELVYSNLVTVNQAKYEATITVTPTVVNATVEGGEGTLTVTYANITEIAAEVYFCDANGEAATYDWIVAEINSENNVDYLIEENEGEARTAYLKVYALDNNAQDVYSILVTINQAKFVVDYATLPFNWEGGSSADFLDLNGASANSLGSDYGSNQSPYQIKLDGTGDYLQVKTDSQPGKVTIGVKMIGGAVTSTITVQGSSDGETFTDIEELTIEGSQNSIHNLETVNEFGENDRYVRLYFTKGSNVGVGPISIARAHEPVVVVAPAAVEVDDAMHDGYMTITFENIEVTDTTNFDVYYYAADGTTTEDYSEWFEAEVTQDATGAYSVYYTVQANAGQARAAYFRVYVLDDNGIEVYSNLIAVSQIEHFNPVMYTKASSIVSGQHYIIVGYKDEQVFAMGAQRSNNRGGVVISEDGNTATVTSANVHEFVISGTTTADSYSIFDERDNGYLCTAGGGNYLRTETSLGVNSKWNISFEETGEANVIASNSNNNNVMRFNYNNGTTIFACYESASQNPVYLYVRSDETPATYTLSINGYGDSEGGYYLIASPINNINPASVRGMTAGDYDLYYFNQTEADEWRNYEAVHFNMASGKGYLYAHKTDVTLNFTGMPYNGDGTVALVKDNNAGFAGWNLVGNPFDETATIDRDFFVMNGLGNEIVAAENNEIAPMQGIFVIADEEGETLTFSTNGNTGSSNPYPFADKGISLNVTRTTDAVIDRAIVRFGEGRQLPKFMLNLNNTKIYVAEGNQDFAVVRSAAQGEMPVSFKAKENGSYTISVDLKNVEMNYLHLIDNMTGADINLLATPSYTFEANTNDYASRFRLVFSANSISENAEGDNTFAFFNGSEWVISNMGEATLQVVDVMGRMLSSETVNGNVTINLNQTPGVYMLRLVNGDNVKVQKVVVK